MANPSNRLHEEAEQSLQMPLIQQYNKTADLSQSYIFKLRPEELR